MDSFQCSLEFRVECRCLFGRRKSSSCRTWAYRRRRDMGFDKFRRNVDGGERAWATLEFHHFISGWKQTGGSRSWISERIFTRWDLCFDGFGGKLVCHQRPCHELEWSCFICRRDQIGGNGGNLCNRPNLY